MTSLVTIEFNIPSKILQKTPDVLASLSFNELLYELCIIYHLEYIPDVKKYISTICDLLDLFLINKSEIKEDVGLIEKEFIKKAITVNLIEYKRKIKNASIELYNKIIDGNYILVSNIITNKINFEGVYLLLKLFLENKIHIDTRPENQIILNKLRILEEYCLKYFKYILKIEYHTNDWEWFETQIDNNTLFIKESITNLEFIEKCCTNVENIKPVIDEFNKLKLVKNLICFEIPDNIKGKVYICYDEMKALFKLIIEKSLFARSNCSYMALKYDDQENDAVSQQYRKLHDQFNTTVLHLEAVII